MKEYKLVQLNEKAHLSREKDLNDAEIKLNSYVKKGWTLQQIVSPNDIGGALIAVLYKEVE
ncbi:hypothetical protein EI71_00739 [Anaeroplasma bactoclasticum]|jgi:hypothetical protein|uniref:DUF4177 domain-containing protein n=1 Tax=Anaeroplasma bactoclasticum TaxID=2088 RepID=A0A397RZH0_9MOLU|nr:hypothetical protein [Anaeroplasma bactoclasticum]RIA77956.1 hypothetical protein EI71_00739 [Anaeroplasma bactoclasticum]